MNIEKLKPWNWFKHEEVADSSTQSIPVTREDKAPAVGSLMRMHREMDRWFDDLSSSLGIPSLTTDFSLPGRSGVSTCPVFRPRIDVSGDNNRYEIKLDVPGMTEDDLSIEVDGDMLLIRGETEQRNENKDEHFYCVERRYGSFQRTLSLPDDADGDEIAAQLESGVLRLQIPRRESASKETRRIAISS